MEIQIKFKVSAYGEIITSNDETKTASCIYYTPVAQWLEPLPHKRLVAGSSPAGSTK